MGKRNWVEETSQFNEDFIKSYNKESVKECFFEVVVQYDEQVHNFHNDLPFLPGRMKIERVEKLFASLHNKTEYVIHIRNLNQALSHGLVFKMVHRNG